MVPRAAISLGGGPMAENVLVIKHGALGDFVMASGRMRTIRQRHPTAHIALVTEAFLMGLARSLGLFDELIEDSRGYHFKVCDNRYRHLLERSHTPGII